MTDMSSSDKYFVAAIDIGTTQSGWALSTRDQFRKNPFEIIINKWSTYSGVSSKILTCILFNKDKAFDSFGLEAEIKYLELVDKGEHHEWYFFKNLKTTLFNKVRILVSLLL